MSEAPAPNKTEGSALHLVRVLLFAGVLALIHDKHEELALARALSPSAPVQLEEVLDLFPAAAALSEVADERGRREVFDGTGERLGSFVRTSPLADDVIGFCGPTDTLIAFDARDRVLGTKIHSSQDTRDHVAAIRGDKRFLSHLIGLTSEEAALNQELDGVSGATLTSVAIQEGVRLRLGGTRTSLRFTAPVELADAKALFPDAASIEPVPSRAACCAPLLPRTQSSATKGRATRSSPSVRTVSSWTSSCARPTTTRSTRSTCARTSTTPHSSEA